MFSVSGCVDAKKSRLLSWPMYFWYSLGRLASDLCARIGIAHVPIRDQIVAVGIRVDEENDHVLQDPHRLVVCRADHAIDHLAELLRAERFRRVQAAVDPHDGLAFFRERARLGFGQPVRQRELSRDVLVAREVLVILRRRHDGHELLAPLGCLADGLQHHAVRLAIQLLPVGRQLLVVRQEVVVAEVVPELLQRRRDRGRRLRQHGARGKRGDESEADGGEAVAAHAGRIQSNR